MQKWFVIEYLILCNTGSWKNSNEEDDPWTD